jgi:F-type H+-transporting ATPase subunit a
MSGFGKYLILICFLSIGFKGPVFAQHDSTAVGKTAEKSSSFNAGKFVIDHVTDAYEWHITTIGKTHISIPLPVLLYSKSTGFHAFMSSRLHHGEASYRGFSIAGEGKSEGKIVETDLNGNVSRPFDFSISKTVAGAIITAFILLICLIMAARASKTSIKQAPSGLLNLLEPLVVFVRDDVAIPAIGLKKYEKYLPLLLTLFFFILLNNLLGLIPIFPFGANVTGNTAVTMVLALFTFVVTTFSGNKHYWKEIFNPEVPWWMKFPIPLMPFVEFLGLLTKPFVLMVRLFANMLAGHLIVTVFVSLIFIFTNLWGVFAGWIFSPVSVLFAVFILLLDVLVSFIQAYVFTLLSALYFGMATAEHH